MFIDRVIGKYKVTRKIGEGGMATVYEAMHTKLHKKVAIKVLNPSYSSNPQVQKRFEREARLMAALEHENITRITDFEEQPGRLCIVMELLGGEDLSSKIRREGPLKDSDAMRIFSQVLKALSYAHQHPEIVAHRDIKPSNIFILPDGKVKILDFGIAKIVGEGLDGTRSGLMLGTPLYMSPEQVRTEKTIDHRTDIYSLGVTMYYALTGKPPYDDTTESLVDIWDKIRFKDFPPIKSKFWPMIQKACKKDRNERYQDCKEWLKDFSRMDQDQTVADEIVVAGKKEIDEKRLEETVEWKHDTPANEIKTEEEQKREVKGFDDPWSKKLSRFILSLSLILLVIILFLLLFQKFGSSSNAANNIDQEVWDSTIRSIGDQGRTDSLQEINSQITAKVIADSTAAANYYDSVARRNQQPGNNVPSIPTVTDNSIAGQVKIGNQIWMTKNLDVDHFRNGDPIFQAKTAEEWERAGETGSPAWCYYNNDPANGSKYGKLYNWYAVNDPRGLAPVGYHIPSDKEWSLLTDFLGGSKVAGGKMKSTSGWANNGNGSNSSGFTGLAGGYRDNNGTFNAIGEYGNWWSSTEYDPSSAWFRDLGYDDGNVYRYGNYKGGGLSVRCLRD